ncbi:MFS transporter [Clostridium transplantifaecale]|uniref:MFS transporter n=1 Tax=Clostridium transplantifaecale TaxID=2479838 RepID=UPI000F637B19|nr:MFS transporter [Clostridium transplantifaecale]
MKNNVPVLAQRPSGFSLFLRCCYGYLINGMAVLIIGSILPSLMKEGGLSFAVAGAMLSCMAVGNFLACFLFPLLSSRLGTRLSIASASFLMPVALFLLTLLPPVPVLYLLMFLCGIGRGSISIINNRAVNDIFEHPAKMLNYLHCSFAVGAFLAPLATAMMITAGLGWRAIVYIITALCASSALLYGTADYSVMENAQARPAQNRESEAAAERLSGKTTKKQPGTEGSPTAFLRLPDFYCISLLLFFYLGLENCVNGWFVTYLQSTGLVSEAYASTLVSITWIVIMAGRLFCAAMLGRFSQGLLILIHCLGSLVCFLFLIGSHSLISVTASLAGLGFFMSGIYPVCIADAGIYIKGSTLGMSVLTATSALGGIMAPQLIGLIADRTGMVQAITFLAASGFCMAGLAAIHLKAAPHIIRKRPEGYEIKKRN